MNFLDLVKYLCARRVPQERKMAFNPTHATVENEDCNLHYYYLGTGPLITFIPGGNGHGRQFNVLMALLSPNFTCVTFDRRQMSDSQVPINKTLSHPQQARDAASVIKAMGFSKSIIFGSSLGAIIGFQLGIDFPDMVDRLIAHEGPTASLLPNSTEIYDALYFCHYLYANVGLKAAETEFRKMFKGYHAAEVSQTIDPQPGNVTNFWENEFWTGSVYTPDLRKLVKNGASVAVMTGERSVEHGTWFSVAAMEQADILRCERCVVAGHHQGFESETELFLPQFLSLLDRMEAQKGEKSEK